MSKSDIRGLGESPAEAKQPHTIYLDGEKVKTFPTYKDAYLYGVSRWGSGSLVRSIVDEYHGWLIVRDLEVNT